MELRIIISIYSFFFLLFYTIFFYCTPPTKNLKNSEIQIQTNHVQFGTFLIYHIIKIKKPIEYNKNITHMQAQCVHGGPIQDFNLTLPNF